MSTPYLGPDLHVNGYRHASYGKDRSLPDGNPILAIARQTGRSTLFCSVTDDPGFDHYFSTWNVTEHHHWNPAFHLEGDALVECEHASGPYLIGDHNI